MHKRTVRLSVLTASLLAASAAHAGPTALFLMPIADILKHREAGATVGLLGYEHNVSKGYDYYNSVTLGLFDKVEIGYDNDFRSTTSANVKIQLHEGKGYAVSAGVTGWSGKDADPYVVARFDGRGYRLHGGAWRTQGATRLMVGTDFPVAAGLTGSLEFLSGTGSQEWASLFYSIPGIPGLGLQAAVGVSSDHAAGIQHAALLYYAFKI